MRYTGRRNRRLRQAGSACLVLLTCFALWCAWGIWRSYHHPVVKTWTADLPRLDGPVRIAVLSDLHDRAFGGNHRQLAELLTSAGPDLILLDGDMLNSDSENSGQVCSLVEQLAAVAPVYYAWGNHELDYMDRETGNLRAELTAAGATVLDRAYVDLTVRGQRIRLGGLYDYAFAADDFNTCDPAHMDPSVYGFLTRFQDTDCCRILLSHRPDSFALGEASVTWNMELVISGHDHGGQVVLPVLGGVFGGDQGLFPAYLHGLYEKDNIRLAITSGLGSHGQKLPRMWNPPEIMVLDLR